MATITKEQTVINQTSTAQSVPTVPAAPVYTLPEELGARIYVLGEVCGEADLASDTSGAEFIVCFAEVADVADFEARMAKWYSGYMATKGCNYDAAKVAFNRRITKYAIEKPLSQTKEAIAKRETKETKKLAEKAIIASNTPAQLQAKAQAAMAQGNHKEASEMLAFAVKAEKAVLSSKEARTKELRKALKTLADNCADDVLLEKAIKVFQVKK